MALSGKNSPSRGTPLEYTRNFGIAAHIDAGKTTTSERILFYAGVIHKTGEVHEGAATTDWMEQEQERGITITSAAISCGWTTADGPFAKIPHRLNVIDTPGHVDFTAEVERSLRVLDGAVAVFCAVAGVQPQSETVWRQMNKYNVPRVAYINKMDRTGADFFNAVKGIREKLRGNAHPLYIPIGAGETFTGLVDLVKGCAYVYDESDPKGMKYAKTDVPADLKADYEKYRESLIEAVSDFDDTIAEKYLEGQEISSDELRVAIRKATLSLDFVGVIPGSSFKNKGVQMVLDAVVDYLPSPLDLPPMKAFKDDGETETGVEPDDNAKPVGLCFKLWSDPYVGQLVFFRLYRGTLKKGDSLYNPRTRKAERVSRLMIMKAMDREEIDTAYSGDICALIGPKEIVTGDTLCAREDDLVLEPPSFPEPVISMSIEPATKADQEKLSIGLQRLAQEDPTFRVSSDQETGQTIISGMGELHLDIIVDRLRREFKVDAKAGRPQISYRETITAPADGEGKFVRQSGGRGQYGHAVIKIEPNPGKGIEVLNEIVGGVIPKEYIKPTIEGIQEAANNGTIAGYPVIDFKAHIVFGSYHEVDSNEMAFRMAGIFALKDAMKKASPILLEPITKVEVVTPEEYQGDIMGDLNRRRGQIQNMETKNGICTIDAFVPLQTMFGYATDVRSLSKGRASYTMEPDHFEQVPANVLKEIVETASRAPARS
ncbi:MAG TPA: elongation factor G [Candidatus Spyradosoma merdigallinarum]|uniref:Elongation factor G n=1 Tax=Candidatus Spyradosoma merdigallinarum TaxID=2840950 RepID=A0A9D1NIY2_9BACT|nr:elongation factor G [Candidatus Spyradosoma merdigallinarum]